VFGPFLFLGSSTRLAYCDFLCCLFLCVLEQKWHKNGQRTTWQHTWPEFSLEMEKEKRHSEKLSLEKKFE